MQLLPAQQWPPPRWRRPLWVINVRSLNPRLPGKLLRLRRPSLAASSAHRSEHAPQHFRTEHVGACMDMSSNGLSGFDLVGRGPDLRLRASFVATGGSGMVQSVAPVFGDEGGIEEGRASIDSSIRHASASMSAWDCPGPGKRAVTEPPLDSGAGFPATASTGQWTVSLASPWWRCIHRDGGDKAGQAHGQVRGAPCSDQPRVRHPQSASLGSDLSGVHRPPMAGKGRICVPAWAPDQARADEGMQVLPGIPRASLFAVPAARTG